MSNIFNRYLVAVTSQRIPMPSLWLEELGLTLTDTQQSRVVTSRDQVGITGYRFQQDEVLQRGYAHRQAISMQLDETSKYLLQLYMQALYEHKGVDYRHYLQTAVYTQEGQEIISKASLIRGLKYYIYIDTMIPFRVSICENDTEIAFRVCGGSTLSQPLVIDTAGTIGGKNLSSRASHDEYFYLVVRAHAKARIVVVDKNRTVDSPNDICLSIKGTAQKLAPSAGCLPIEYADKLIPALADMQVTEDSPVELQSILDGLVGSSLKERIINNTEGIYDIDENLGAAINLRGA